MLGVPLFFSRSKDWSERCTHAMSLATFIDQEAFDGTGSPGAPFAGARGRPLLIK